jgi:hypothetical protein
MEITHLIDQTNTTSPQIEQLATQPCPKIVQEARQ